MFPIKGNKICLRLPEEKDAEIIFSWENIKSVTPINSNHETVSKTDVLLWLSNRHHDLSLEKELRLMICIDDKCIGSVDLFEFDEANKRAGLGIIVEENYRRQGVASEAILLIKNYFFSQLKMNSLWCNIAANNSSSIHLFENCGFALSGVKKKWRRYGEKEFVDELFFQAFA